MDHAMSLGKMLIIGGLAIALLGVIISAGSRFGLGRLPGDIVIKRDGFTLYFPIVTSIVLSVILTVLLWIVQGWRR